MSSAYHAQPATADELRSRRDEIRSVLAANGLHNPQLHGDGLGEVVVHLDAGRSYADLGAATVALYELTGRRVMLYPAAVVDRPGASLTSDLLEPL